MGFGNEKYRTRTTQITRDLTGSICCHRMYRKSKTNANWM